LLKQMLHSKTMEELNIKIDGKEHIVKVEETENGKIRVHLENEVFEVETKREVEEEILNIEKDKDKNVQKKVISAPMPGVVISINVKKGDMVKEGDSLIKLVAMKMENDIIAERNGIVKEIKAKKNSSVNTGDILIVLE